jgi:hypothetical protein
VATPTSFSLPQTQRAFQQWSSITGHGWDSAEWGEVWQALEDCDLLRADRVPERALFDLPETRLGDTRNVVHLRAAIVAGALLHDDETVTDPATGTEVVAALLPCLYNDLVTYYSYGELLASLMRDLPTRCLSIHASPSAALADLLRATPGEVAADAPAGLAAVIMEVALCDDRIAETVFARLSTDPAQATTVIPLSSGRWLRFRCG